MGIRLLEPPAPEHPLITLRGFSGAGVKNSFKRLFNIWSKYLYWLIYSKIKRSTSDVLVCNMITELTTFREIHFHDGIFDIFVYIL